MKKFLSLMLAMIMVMSLVTVGAGATFTDDADIEQKEAVALLSGLGILEGPGDGTFNPKGTISRGAAAKILTWLLEGKAKADAIKAAGVEKSSFSDVPATSSNAAFIEYCAMKGIVSGRSDGTFRRADGLTGQAFLKMVLVALGVKDIDFNTATNPGWAIDATVRAEEMGLLDGIDTDKVLMSAQLSRENACQIAFNALGYTAVESTKYNVVKADGSLIVSCDTKEDATMILALRADAASIVKVEDKSTSLGAKVFNLGEYTGIVTKNGATNKLVADAGKTTVGGKTFKVATGLELIGHNVTVYYNTKTNAVYTVYDNSKTLKLANKATDLANLAAALDIDEDEVKAEYACTVYDGTYAAADGKITVNLETEKASSGTAIIVYNEVAEEYEVIGFVKAATKFLDKVTKVTTTKDKETITLEGFGTIVNGKLNSDEKAEDAIVEYDGIAKDDYVVVTKTGDIYTVAKAKTVAGKATKIDGAKLTINGTTYSQNTNNKTTVKNTVDVADYAFDTEYTLYLDGTGKYFVAATAEAAKNEQVVFFVEGYEKTETKTDAYKGTYTETTYWAQCVNLDGEKVLFQTETKVDLANGLYTVTLTEDEDDEVEYATFAVKGISTNTDIKATDIKVDSIYYFADDVKFISVEEKTDLAKTKVTVKTGAQLVSKTMYFAPKAEKVDGVATGNYTVAYVFVDGKFDTAAAKPTDEIAYAIETKDSTAKVPYVKSDKTQTGFEHTVYIDGVKTTIVTTDAGKLQGFVELTKVVDGVYSTKANTAENLFENVTIANVFKGMISIAGQDKLEDINVTETEIFDLRDEDTLAEDKELVTDAEGLEKGMKLAIVVDTTDKDAWTIATIYVIG